MPDDEADWQTGLPEQLRGALDRAAGELPANVALMQLLMACREAGQAEASLPKAIADRRSEGDGPGADRLAGVLELLRAQPQAFAVVQSVLGGLDHDRRSGADALGYWSDAFDAAARQNPEGSVALYALGDPALFEAATEEIAGRLDEWGLLTPRRTCLDIGCGIGRFEAALAGRLAHIVGIDISEVMLETARRRCSGLSNVEFRKASGRDLSGFADANFDLVLAVDVFPYVVASGPELTAAMVGEAARVLRPAGRLVILNFSYRGDLERDRDELRALAAGSGLRIVRDGTAEFSLWDGIAFDLEKA